MLNTIGTNYFQYAMKSKKVGRVLKKGVELMV